MIDLTYNIATGILEGRLGGVSYKTIAGSGGRAGSKTPGAVNWHLSGNPFATAIGGRHSEGTNIYGPLPMGEYELWHRPGRKHWIDLRPMRGYMHGRGGFAIHGRGPIGSHGCIVVYSAAELERLQHLVEVNAESGRTAYRLRVVAIGQDLDSKLHTA